MIANSLSSLLFMLSFESVCHSLFLYLSREPSQVYGFHFASSIKTKTKRERETEFALRYAFGRIQEHTCAMRWTRATSSLKLDRKKESPANESERDQIQIQPSSSLVRQFSMSKRSERTCLCKRIERLVKAKEKAYTLPATNKKTANSNTLVVSGSGFVANE